MITASRISALTLAVRSVWVAGVLGAGAVQAQSVISLSSLNGQNGFRLDGVLAEDRLGWSVASAGDINGDGVHDLVIGAPGADPNGLLSGSSYVLFGRSGTTPFASSFDLDSLDGNNGFRLDGAATGDESGRSVASARDVNGDGLDDLIIGASRADPDGKSSGSSYVLFGRSGPAAFASGINLGNLNGSDGFRMEGALDGDSSGASVSAAGDINADGVGDLIVGAPMADPNDAQSGSSYIVFGRSGPIPFGVSINLSSMDGNLGFRIDGESTQDQCGYWVSAAGDINDDGLDDIVVGAYAASGGASGSGSSYVVFGRPSTMAFPSSLQPGSLDGTIGFRIDGVGNTDHSGRSIASAGDVNDDGLNDLIIGAVGADVNGQLSGSSYVVFGRSGTTPFAASLSLGTLDGSNGFRLAGEAAADLSGFSVASAGDINGDDIADLIIGAPYTDQNGVNAFGSSYLVFGRSGDSPFSASINLSSLNGTTGVRFDGVAAGDESGYSTAGAGDINGDGIDDLIIGARGASHNGFASGSAYVVFGVRDAVFKNGFE
jgi:hypothetical protein